MPASSEELVRALDNYSADMRERLAVQRKTLESLMGAISGSIKEARSMMTRMERLNLETEIAEMQEFSEKAVLRKKPKKTSNPKRVRKTAKKKGAKK